MEGYKWGLLAAAQGDEDRKEKHGRSRKSVDAGADCRGTKAGTQFQAAGGAIRRGATVQARLLRRRARNLPAPDFSSRRMGISSPMNMWPETGRRCGLVTSAGLIPAKVMKVDAANDLALLKAEGKFAALPVAPSRSMKLGSTVATVGFPNIGLQGFAPKFARGEIGSLSGPEDDARYFQISVPVQPGNSGGALVDERGNVVGVVSAKLSAKAALATSGALPENVNYAVKSSFLLSFLESVPEVAAKLKEPNTKD